MSELVLIKKMISREEYKKYSDLLNREYLRFNLPECYKLVTLLDYINKEDIQVSNQEEFEAVFWAEYPALNKKDRQLFSALFDKMRAAEIGEETLDHIVTLHRERAAAAAIASVALSVSDGKRPFSALADAFSQFSPAALPGDDDSFVPDDLNLLLTQTYDRPGVKWKLRTLRKMMGSLRKGDMGFVFARPEVGKTTFLADQCSYFASQLDGPLIHFNNEEYGPKVKLRYYQAALGLTTKELMRDVQAFQEDYLKHTKANILIYDSAAISRSDVERICETHSPKMLVFDSIDKIKGFDDDRDDLVYKQIYQWARELSKEYGPVIGICHASVSAEGKKWLTMDDVAYAKTAKQGEADWILGIGANYEAGQENLRHLHLSKNKLMGDEESDEKFRHGRLPVMIHPDIAQYSDILNFEDDV